VKVIFVRSEQNTSDILPKNVPEKLLIIDGKSIRNGTLQCREDWTKIIQAILLTDESIHHIQGEDVELWIQQHMYKARWSKLSMTVHDDYMSYHDSFDVLEPRLQLCCVELGYNHGNTLIELSNGEPSVTRVTRGLIIGCLDGTMMALELEMQSNRIFI
jgi:hypothetical protein